MGNALKAATCPYTSKHGSSAAPHCPLGFADGPRRRGGEAELSRERGRDLDLCNNNKTPRVNAGVRRLNAYTTNMKEANGNSRRVPTWSCDICNHQRLTCSTLVRRWPARRFVAALLILHGQRLKANGNLESSVPQFLAENLRPRLCKPAFPQETA